MVYASFARITLVVSLILVASGCTTRVGDFSVVSTGAPQYDSMGDAPIEKTVTAKDSRVWFLFIPFGGEPNMKDAVDRCLDKGEGDFIERARMYESSWTILLFSYGAYKVIGDVGNSKFEQGQSQADGKQKD